MRSYASGGARLREDLSAIIDSKELAISNLQKGYLRSRWLEQLVRMDRSYNRAYRSYYALRLTTGIGCLVILLLVSFNLSGQEGAWASSLRTLTILSSLLVSICVVVEHLYNFSERYQRYERVAERLKAEGWRFLQLSGPYHSHKSHSEAFAVFANQVEALNQMDTEVYSFDVIRERPLEASFAEVDVPKKLDSSPQGSAELIDTPVVMRSVARPYSNPQRTQ